MPKRGGRFFIKAYLAGGAEHNLPFRVFGSVKVAKAWIEEYARVREREERNARYAAEESLYF